MATRRILGYTFKSDHKQQEGPLHFPGSKPQHKWHPHLLTRRAHQRVFVSSDSALPLCGTPSICLPSQPHNTVRIYIYIYIYNKAFDPALAVLQRCDTTSDWIICHWFSWEMPLMCLHLFIFCGSCIQVTDQLSVKSIVLNMSSRAFNQFCSVITGVIFCGNESRGKAVRAVRLPLAWWTAGSSLSALVLFIYCVTLARSHCTVGEITSSEAPQNSISRMCVFMIYGSIVFLLLRFNDLVSIKIKLCWRSDFFSYRDIKRAIKVSVPCPTWNDKDREPLICTRKHCLCSL